jgi:hypothetical protein
MKMAQTAPSFILKPDRLADVDEGDVLELKAKLDGSPIPTVKWYLICFNVSIGIIKRMHISGIRMVNR